MKNLVTLIKKHNLDCCWCVLNHGPLTLVKPDKRYFCSSSCEEDARQRSTMIAYDPLRYKDNLNYEEYKKTAEKYNCL